jgi:hypothetical protein
MLNVRTGFNIVIGGRDFDPDCALSGVSLAPDAVRRRGEQLQANECFIEFAHFSDDVFRLDMFNEAIHYIKMNYSDFQRLCFFHGVEYRCLNFVDDVATGGLFVMDDQSLSVINELKFALQIQVLSAPCRIETA